MINDIKGIEILYADEVITNWTWGFSWVGLVMALIALFGVVSLIVGIINADLECGAIGVGLTVVGGAVALLFFSQATPVYTTEYYVTIDEKVPVVEIFKDYKVHDVKDQIYVLRLRNN